MSGTGMLRGLLGREEDGYVVRARRSASGVFKALSGTAAAVSFYLTSAWIAHGSPWHLQPFFVLGSVLFAVLSWTSVVRPREVLRINHTGVEFGAIKVPWPSIWHFVVLRQVAEPGGPIMVEAPQLGLRLKRGAPLPEGIGGLIIDPNDPLAIHDYLRTNIARGRLDVEAVVAVADRYAPADVQLVERNGEQEAVLPRQP